MTTDEKRDTNIGARRPPGRIGTDELLAQVQAMTEGDEVAPVSQRNRATKGLRAYFQPLTGKRRTGLVALAAIRTRLEGQVRTGDLTGREDFPDLVASVRAHGVLQPVGLTWDEPADLFWTDFGHRRIEAARAAGLDHVPAVISVPDGVPIPDGALAEKQLVENLQRTQLPALDVALALKRLVDVGTPAADLARRIGRSPSWVAKHLKFLQLPEEFLLEADRKGLGYSTSPHSANAAMIREWKVPRSFSFSARSALARMSWLRGSRSRSRAALVRVGPQVSFMRSQTPVASRGHD